MDLYLGLDDMPIYNFDKILKTNNMSYMVVGWNERDEIEPPENTVERWGNIYNKYCELTANNEALSYYSLSCEISYLEMRYLAIYSLINNLCEPYKEEIGKRLNKWGVPFNISGKIEPQIKQLERQLRIAKQNIGIKKRKLEALKNDDEPQENALIKQVLIVNEQLGVKIDIRVDSVTYFLVALERLKEKLQASKRNG